MDYLHLFRQHGCTLRAGGSDQWGNHCGRQADPRGGGRAGARACHTSRHEGGRYKVRESRVARSGWAPP
ncbi:MAG: hypothetical protein WKF82_06530 [Nocardioidaceae bacterium]